MIQVIYKYIITSLNIWNENYLSLPIISFLLTEENTVKFPDSSLLFTYVYVNIYIAFISINFFNINWIKLSFPEICFLLEFLQAVEWLKLRRRLRTCHLHTKKKPQCLYNEELPTLIRYLKEQNPTRWSSSYLYERCGSLCDHKVIGKVSHTTYKEVS